MAYELIATFETKDNNFHTILRDNFGKWYVSNGNNERVQKRLTAKEIVRYLANALEGK